MNRGQQRTVLRGWLREATADQWTDTQVDTYLNLGLREVQKLIVSLDPESVKKTYVANLIAGTVGADSIYSYPAGTWGVIEMGISADGINYSPMKRISLAQARAGYYPDNGTDTQYAFVPWSPREFSIYPMPAATVVNGLRAIVVPTLTMAVDADEFPAQLGFETLALKEAQRFALRDVGEPHDTLDAEIQAEKSETPRFFWTSSEPAFVTPQIDRGY